MCHLRRRPMDDKTGFRLEEFKALRKQLELTLEEISTLSRYALFGSAAVISWLIGAPPRVDPHMLRWAWWVPATICFFAGFRVLALGFHIWQFAQYLHHLETRFRVAGWEHFLELQRKNYPIT